MLTLGEAISRIIEWAGEDYENASKMACSIYSIDIQYSHVIISFTDANTPDVIL